MPVVSHLDGGSSPVHNIFCIGRNYFAHALELGNEPPSEPIVFLKSTRSLRPLDRGGVAFVDETYHHEAELVLRVGASVPLGSAPGWEVVSHVALGLDLTRRALQKELKGRGLPWALAKSFHGAALIGPLVPLERFADPGCIQFSLRVNGELRQRGDMSQVSFDVPAILAYLAAFTTLDEGDLIYTGTPSGVADFRSSDRFELRFDGTDMSFSGVL
ncbi:MAG: 2-keto-4-pentenoate hydratase/2-oxohepta-3-ene-1,7-dioic acid hydratase in catechol pathway [Kiritimatiellia bacterium]|jgi:2-keto-4-pentenoate hydratase/2-oxohepta-3-ene-1,7-dioic acid hydratase in catechol pathway